MSINIGVTAAAILGYLVVWLIVDLPDLQVGRATVFGALVALVTPVLVFPFCKTVWAAIDLWMHGYDASDE
jgi:hypothetical protein